MSNQDGALVADFGEREIAYAQAGGMSLHERSEIDIQVATAKRWPRQVSKFLREAESMIRESQPLAEKCFYTVPRAGKHITGGSIRLAEIAASTWGNMRLYVTIGRDDGREVTLEGVAWDLETNVAYRVPVVRRLVDRNGDRYSDDVRINTMNAGASIALRNAINRAIPKAYLDQLETVARRTAAGDLKTLPVRRSDCLEWLKKRGAVEAHIFFALGVHGLEDIGLEELTTLQGIKNALEEGATTIDDAFPAPKAAGDDDEKPEKQVPARGVAAARQRVNRAAPPEAPAAAPTEPAGAPEPQGGTTDAPAPEPPSQGNQWTYKDGLAAWSAELVRLGQKAVPDNATLAGALRDKVVNAAGRNGFEASGIGGPLSQLTEQEYGVLIAATRAAYAK